MYEFEISRPSTLAEATSSLNGVEASALAGGQSLLPTMKLRLADPGALVDLAGVSELRGIAVNGDTVTIGAMTTHAEVAGSADVRNAIPALADLAGLIGDPAVRHRGTIGGSVANADPAADYPAAVLGLGATINTSTRAIAADDFFLGLFETALADGELITSISFPIPTRAAYSKFPQPASRFAMVGVFVAATTGGARVAVTGAGASVFRVSAMEQSLNGEWAVASVAGVSVSPDGLNADLHGSARYRAHLTTVMAERAVEAA
jgi:aerobic carbon-monoxide dehydrogenase medium subunit